MSKHAPTPWEVSEGDHERPFYVIAQDAPMGERLPATADTEANAEHIVRCVNAHDDLLEALTRCRAVLVTALGDRPEDLRKPDRAATLGRRIAFASAAIAKAKGGGQ